LTTSLVVIKQVMIKDSGFTNILQNSPTLSDYSAAISGISRENARVEQRSAEMPKLLPLVSAKNNLNQPRALIRELIDQRRFPRRFSHNKKENQEDDEMRETLCLT